MKSHQRTRSAKKTPPVNQREAAKQATRAKVLDAARALFEDPGYDATTVRMIAERAGVSAGSVFATFASKEELLAVIVAEGHPKVLAMFEAGIARGGPSVRGKLKAAFSQALRLEHTRLAMQMHQIGASWTWSRSFERKAREDISRSFKPIADLIDAGIEEGELRADCDRTLAMDLLLGVYLRAFRTAWYRELDADGMADFATRQLDLVLDGLAAK